MTGQNMDTQGRAFGDRAEVCNQCSYSKATLRSARHAAAGHAVSMITVIRQPDTGYLPGSKPWIHRLAAVEGEYCC
jgi:hypothetical protein